MIASELIVRLQNLIALHGDLPIAGMGSQVQFEPIAHVNPYAAVRDEEYSESSRDHFDLGDAFFAIINPEDIEARGAGLQEQPPAAILDGDADNNLLYSTTTIIANLLQNLTDQTNFYIDQVNISAPIMALGDNPPRQVMIDLDIRTVRGHPSS